MERILITFITKMVLILFLMDDIVLKSRKNAGKGKTCGEKNTRIKQRMLR